MLDRIINFIKQILIFRQIKPFDPASLQDPLALKTAWTPAKGGGSNFTTHRLYQRNTTKIELKPTIGALIFYWIFLLVGIGITSGILINFYFEQNRCFDMPILIALFIGLVFGIVGFFLLKTGTTPIVFDKTYSLFWKGKILSGQIPEKELFKEACELQNIHAIQILSEFCRGNKSSYYSYEMNLILKDCSRINVVDHGSLQKLREDAKKLSVFLNVPVWDALQY